MAFKNKADAVKYNNEFIKQAYDRINLTVPKGQKEMIQMAAKQQNESVNAYIGRLIREDMERKGMLYGGSSDLDPQKDSTD